jgi:ribosomal protein L11 methyltransferase
VANAIAPDGRLILAGLLDHQAPAVAAAYRREGLMLTARIDRGEWPTLVMRKRRATPLLRGAKRRGNPARRRQSTR